MAKRSAAPLVLREGDREELAALAGHGRADARLALRARIVLLAAQGLSNTEIARREGVARATVLSWRERYAHGGIAALEDALRPGPRPAPGYSRIVAESLRPVPDAPAASRGSSRMLAARLGISNSTLTRAWRACGVRPGAAGMSRFSTEPELVAKVGDIVGLYLGPPQNAIMLRADPQNQAPARTATVPPVRPRPAGEPVPDDGRQGAPALSAALERPSAGGGAPARPGAPDQEFLAFLRQAARSCPGQDLHLLMDGHALHGHPGVLGWLAANPRTSLHFTRTRAVWLNLVEVCFAIIEPHPPHPGAPRCAEELGARIRACAKDWNDRSHPFAWARTTEEGPAHGAPSNT